MGYVSISPTAPSVPAATHPPTIESNHSCCVIPLPNLVAAGPMGAHTAGKEILRPKIVVEVSAFATSCTLRIMSFTCCSAVKLFWNDMLVPLPAIPPASPAQATPSHTGQTRHVGYRRSRALTRTSLYTRRPGPWAPGAPDGAVCCAEARAGTM